MSVIMLEAETRSYVGKGASRRLRRLENKVPAIIYGGNKEPESINIAANKLYKAMENENIHASILDLQLNGQVEKVVLKSFQRHPYKSMILHIDFQRVSAKDVIVKHVPIHFINEQSCKGVKAGGMINHAMTQVEIRCQAKDLPEFIEVDMANVELNHVVHLSDLKLPKDVQFKLDIKNSNYNLPVVSIHSPKGSMNEEKEETATATTTASPNKPE